MKTQPTQLSQIEPTPVKVFLPESVLLRRTDLIDIHDAEGVFLFGKKTSKERGVSPIMLVGKMDGKIHPIPEKFINR